MRHPQAAGMERMGEGHEGLATNLHRGSHPTEGDTVRTSSYFLPAGKGFSWRKFPSPAGLPWLEERCPGCP